MVGVVVVTKFDHDGGYGGGDWSSLTIRCHGMDVPVSWTMQTIIGVSGAF